jgi:hypothetical protein
MNIGNVGLTDWLLHKWFIFRWGGAIIIARITCLEVGGTAVDYNKCKPAIEKVDGAENVQQKKSGGGGGGGKKRAQKKRLGHATGIFSI